MKQSRQVLVLGGVLLLALTLISVDRAGSQSALGQLQRIGGSLPNVPEVPPPVVDQEGTEAAWDITHPGWREWRNPPAQTATSAQADQAEILALRMKQEAQQKQLEEAQRRQEEEARRRRELEQYWQQVQAQQRQQQAQLMQQEAERRRIFEQAKQALLVNFRVPTIPAVDLSAPMMDAGEMATWPSSGQASFGQAPASQELQAGLSPQQWQQARQYQGLIRTLRQSSSVPPEDEAILAQVEARRNALWAKAVSVPKLPDDARETLALTLPVTQAGGFVPRITRDDIRRVEAAAADLKKAGEKAVPTLLDCINDMASDNLPESAAVESAVKQFGNLLSVAKITMAAAKGGASSAIAESVDFVVGTIPFPQAKIAVSGGRIYANVAFQAMNRFMTEAAKVTGVKPDLDAFWQEVKDDLAVGQKAVMEFIDYGPTD